MYGYMGMCMVCVCRCIGVCVCVLDTPIETLAEMIRPSGYFNIKAQRLRAFCIWYRKHGGGKRLKYWHTARLRKALLSINGIGQETADDILLYAFNRCVFVIDAYTRRMFSRLGLITGDEDYDELRMFFERALPRDAKQYAEYHALIVNHGKDVCRPHPHCARCIFVSICPSALT